MVHSRPPNSAAAPTPGSPFGAKKNTTFLQNLIDIFRQQSQAAPTPQAAGQLLAHLLAHCLCLERHTITGLLGTAGQQDRDWTRAYRLYREQLQAGALFTPLRQAILGELKPQAPWVVAVDDSTMTKSGKFIPGAGWHRDPLSPAFHTNLTYGHKFIQLSAAVPNPNNPKRARLIPVDCQLIPKVPKLPKDPTPEQTQHHRERKEYHSPSAHALRMLQALRQEMDACPQGKGRPLWVCGDGHYSTRTLLHPLPQGCVYIGRVRGDTHLCAVPKAQEPSGPGRPLDYGDKLPTPDQLRKDPNHPWQTLKLPKDGSTVLLRYKHLPQAKWAAAGPQTTVQLVVIAPLRYRRKKQGPWRYTQPAYLIGTDPSIPVACLIQTYLWRWGIEVNFKEQKQLFGLGQAQVRHRHSVANAPTVCIAAYAGLLWAGVQTFGFEHRPLTVDAPKWYPRKRKRRATTGNLLRQLRHETTAGTLAVANFSDFSLKPSLLEKAPKSFSLPSQPIPALAA